MVMHYSAQNDPDGSWSVINLVTGTIALISEQPCVRLTRRVAEEVVQLLETRYRELPRH